mgnify:CR=1 FL=1
MPGPDERMEGKPCILILFDPIVAGVAPVSHPKFEVFLVPPAIRLLAAAPASHPNRAATGHHAKRIGPRGEDCEQQSHRKV